MRLVNFTCKNTLTDIVASHKLNPLLIQRQDFCDFELSAPTSEEVNTGLTGDETHSLGSHEVEDIGNAATSSSAPITSEEVARQIKAATDPLTKQLEKLCELLIELRRGTSRSSEETFGLVQGPPQPRIDRFDDY